MDDFLTLAAPDFAHATGTVDLGYALADARRVYIWSYHAPDSHWYQALLRHGRCQVRLEGQLLDATVRHPRPDEPIYQAFLAKYPQTPDLLDKDKTAQQALVLELTA